MTARRATARPAVLLLVLVLVGACNSTPPSPSPSPSAAPSPTPSAPASSATPSAGPSAAPSGEPSAADAIYDEIELEVAEIRGLQPTGSVERRTLSEAELATEIEQLYREESPPELVAANERYYKALGLLPADASLDDLTIEMLSGGVAGYYRDDEKRLYVVSRTGGVGVNEKVTFAHEFDHALQDQHFTIFADQQDVTGRSDWLLARQAVYEGDATLLMTVWMTQNFTAAEFQEMLALGVNDPSTEMLERMPAILRDTLLYPYTTGFTFVQGVFTRGGWDAVNQLYEDVPQSTEQILHPEKWEAGEAPVEIDLPDELAGSIGPSWEVALEDTFGEFQMSIWLSDLGAANARSAAAGWGGDRIAVLDGPGDAWAVVLATEWDSAAEAQEFETAAGPIVDGLDDLAALLPGARGTARWVVVASSDDVLEAVAGALGLAG